MLKVEHEHHHYHHYPEGIEILMAISVELQAQLDRLGGYVDVLKKDTSAQAAEDTAAVTAALDTAGAPPAPAPVAPPAA